MHKSILVAVDSFNMSSKYKVWRKTTSKLMAHDELNSCNVGDRVKIINCRPLSKNKAFMLVEILQREKVYDAKATSQQSDAQSNKASAAAAASLPGGTRLSPKQSGPGSVEMKGFAASAFT